MPRSTGLRATHVRALTALATVAAIAAAGLVSAGPASADSETGPAAGTADASLTSAPVDPGTRLTEFPLPNPSSLPNDVVAGSDGSIWVSTFADKQVLRMSRDGAITTTAQLTGGPSSLATDGEGGAWAAEYASNAIAHISAAGAVTEYSIPTASSFPAHVYDAGDLVFFTESNTGKLGRLTQSTGAITEYPIAGATTLWAISGIDERLFISDTSGNMMRQVTHDGVTLRSNPFLGFSITQISDLAGAGGTYSGLVVAEDEVSRFTWLGSAALNSSGSGRSSVSGAVSQKGRVWFVDSGTRTVVTLGAAGELAEYSLPGTGDLSAPVLTEGRYIWTADKASGRLQRLDTVIGLQVTRHGGADRYELAVALAREQYSSGSDSVFVVNGEKFSDALSVGPIAAGLNAPLLLTPGGSLPPSVSREIESLRPKHVYVVGGNASVSDSTFAEVAALVPGASTERIGGADRYAVSRALQARALLPEQLDRIYVADGRNFPDALSAIPNATNWGTYILLVNGSQSTLGADDVSLVRKYFRVEIAGGPASVSTGIEDQINSFTKGGAARRGGADRFAVSDALASDFRDGTASTVYLASGYAFADALAGGAIAGSVRAPLLLSHQDCVPSATVTRILAMGAQSVQLLGGVNTLDDDVAALKECA